MVRHRYYCRSACRVDAPSAGPTWSTARLASTVTAAVGITVASGPRLLQLWDASSSVADLDRGTACPDAPVHARLVMADRGLVTSTIV